jgi:hypothetical protein
VASGTSADSHAIVAELGVGEVLRGVAGIAGSHGGQMLNGLDHVIARQSQTAGVATRTVLGCALKNAFDVATFASRIGVHTGQRKAGFKVVKILGGGLRHGLRSKQRQGQSQ